MYGSTSLSFRVLIRDSYSHSLIGTTFDSRQVDMCAAASNAEALASNTTFLQQRDPDGCLTRVLELSKLPRLQQLHWHARAREEWVEERSESSIVDA
jgi:hypothetical protein